MSIRKLSEKFLFDKKKDLQIHYQFLFIRKNLYHPLQNASYNLALGAGDKNKTEKFTNKIFIILMNKLSNSLIMYIVAEPNVILGSEVRFSLIRPFNENGNLLWREAVRCIKEYFVRNNSLAQPDLYKITMGTYARMNAE